MAAIRLDNLCKRFERVDVVKDVNLNIGDGEFIVLVGPSGCGKSTTLRMLAGLEDPTGGEIWFGDSVVTQMNPSQRNIAMVFQSYALYPHMSVARNMAFALEQRQVPGPEIDVKVRNAAQLLGIQELLERKPKALSGGQRQRVAMGRAIVRSPDVFLFDEPLSNLDAALRTQMRLEIKKLHQMLKTTVIYVTHDQIEAMTLADRIVVMDKGRVVQVGTPMDVYERPLTRFVAGFIGAPQMNFVPANVERHDGASFELVFDNGRRWAVPPSQVARFTPFEGRSVELGIRPEHVLEGVSARPTNVSFSVVPDVVEPTGADTMVFFGLNGVDVAVRCRPSRSIEAGKKIDLTIDFDRIYLVDPASGMIVQPSGQDDDSRSIQ
jgi:multiple sugar transport system ATP-binding protein